MCDGDGAGFASRVGDRGAGPAVSTGGVATHGLTIGAGAGGCCACGRSIDQAAACFAVRARGAGVDRARGPRDVSLRGLAARTGDRAASVSGLCFTGNQYQREQTAERKHGTVAYQMAV